MLHVLVVEDDRELNQAVCRHLNAHGYQPVGCESAGKAYDRLYAEPFDIIISDIMMPEIDGFEFARTVRDTDRNIPILFITARDDLGSKQKGYRLGIDDYMVKPIDLDELILRIEALLRRANISAQKRLAVGNLVLEEDEMQAYLDGEPLPQPLTAREFQILFKLLSYPKRIFTRSQLLDEFSGIENESGLRTVDVHIKNLRDKLAGCPNVRIQTVRGFGYKAVIV